MQVHTNIEDLNTLRKPIVTIGTFDGVHAGHRTIIERIREIAQKRGGQSVLVTFEPHPRFLINPNHNLKLLTTLEEKKILLEEMSLDHLVIAPFTKVFAEQEAKEYVEDFLIKRIRPEVLVIGYDHHFGKNRSGNLSLLEQYVQKGFFDLEEISKQQVDDAHVSSTTIRKAIEQGNIREANTLLQSNYQLSGIVVKGDQKGRTIGFPTANLEIDSTKKLIPANGVYAVKALINNNIYEAVMNIGYRPTINDEKELRLEVHIFSFEADIYHKTLKIEFIERIRDEQKFESFEALKKQIQIDAECAKKVFQ